MPLFPMPPSSPALLASSASSSAAPISSSSRSAKSESASSGEGMGDCERGRRGMRRHHFHAAISAIVAGLALFYHATDMHAQIARQTDKDTANLEQAMSPGFQDYAIHQPWVACTPGSARRREGTSATSAHASATSAGYCEN